MNRRTLLKSLGLASAGLLAGIPLARAGAGKKVLRIAHLTDIHVMPGLRAPRGLARCFSHVREQAGADLIFNGGDCIMDAMRRDKHDVAKQWKTWNKIVAEEVSMPMVNSLGNHDVWGKGNKNDKLYGKAWALDVMQLPQPYYSFSRNGWHFIVLDSINISETDWFRPQLDEAQFEWLQQELQSVPADRPVMVMSHVPILSAAALYLAQGVSSTGGKVHADSQRITHLFSQHKNVKLCISGHLHLLDRAEFNGVTYFCNGSVSGKWWYGSYHETPPGYAVLDLYSDGSFERNYVQYRRRA